MVESLGAPAIITACALGGSAAEEAEKAAKRLLTQIFKAQQGEGKPLTPDEEGEVRNIDEAEDF